MREKHLNFLDSHNLRALFYAVKDGLINLFMFLFQNIFFKCSLLLLNEKNSTAVLLTLRCSLLLLSEQSGVLILGEYMHLHYRVIVYKLSLRKVLKYTGFFFFLSVVYRILLIKFGSPFLFLLVIFFILGHFPLAVISIEFLLKQSFITLFFGFNFGALLLSLRLLFFGDLILFISIMERHASTHKFMIFQELNATTIDYIKPKTKSLMDLWKDMPSSLQNVLVATQKPGYSHFVGAVRRELLQPKPMTDLFRNDWLQRESVRLYFTQFQKFYMSHQRFRREPVVNSVFIPEKDYKPTPQDMVMALWMSGHYPGYGFTFTPKFFHEFLHRLRFSPSEGWPIHPKLEYMGDFVVYGETALPLLEFKTQVYDIYKSYKETVSEEQYEDTRRFRRFVEEEAPFILKVKEKALDFSWKKYANIDILILKDGGLLTKHIKLPLIEDPMQKDIRVIRVYGTGDPSLYEKFNPEEVTKFVVDNKLTSESEVNYHFAKSYAHVKGQFQLKDK